MFNIMKNYMFFTNDLPFLPERMKLHEVEKIVANLHHKKEYVIHIGILRQELNYRLVMKNVHKVIKTNQEIWLKPYIDINTELQINTKNDFEK